MTPARILIVEDNSEHQRLLLHAIADGRPFIDACIVSDGDSFRVALTRERFDCIVLDFKLTPLTAPEILESLREEIGTTPVIVVSSCQEQAIVIESLRLGVVDFVPKSEAVCGNSLWNRIERAMAEANAQREERRQAARREQQLVECSETDPLTNAKNRRYLERVLQDPRFFSDRRKSIACVMLDIDHFKRFNDEYGHAFGDDVLRAVVAKIQQQMGPEDILVRWGGEEFLVIHRQCDETTAWIWAEQLRESMGEIRFAQHPEVRVSASLGLEFGAISGMSLQMIGRADEALYLAKESGRNMVCPYRLLEFINMARATGDDMDSLQHRYFRFVDQLMPRLGPTQFDHIGRHSHVVAIRALGIAQKIGLAESQQNEIFLAGLMHDIGKCVTPESLLAKPTRLDDDERLVMHRHSDTGAMICHALGAPQVIQDAVRFHHATGPTDVTRCPSPPFLHASIISVADAITTMLTDRPYQARRSVQDVQRELWECRGTQFDPFVVETVRDFDCCHHDRMLVPL